MSRYAETDSQRYLWHLQQLRRKKRARRREDVEPPVVIDPDAAAYITAVEAADEQPLETAVQEAINEFVIGCKADGIWDAIKASCIMAGARTLLGALVPLKGDAPTNFNFVPMDYDRVTGLKGDGSTKYLNSNRIANDDPQNNMHLSVYRTEKATGNGGLLATSNTSTGRKQIFEGFGVSIFQANGGSGTAIEIPLSGQPEKVFLGVSRSQPDNFLARAGSIEEAAGFLSSFTTNENLRVFQQQGLSPTNARLSFYSIGEALDLALLDTRVTALMTAIDEALS